MESRWSTSLTLLCDLRVGGATAWRKFLYLYTPLIASWCRKAGLQEADAADVCQEVFHGVNAGISDLRFGPDHSFRGWLWTITRRCLAKHFERCLNSPTAVGGTDAIVRMNSLPGWIREDSAPDGSDGSGEVLMRAAEMIRGDFEEKTWQAFWLSTVENRPPAEISTQLNMTVNAVRQARFRVLVRLREFVGYW
jgi:RNA polymerase sigma-70 factor (ECF subfamily)